MLSVRTFCRRIPALYRGEEELLQSKSQIRKCGCQRCPKDTAIGGIIERVSDICIQRWRLVLAAALFLSMAGIYADTLVQVDTDFKNYVPQDLPPLIDFRHLSDIFGGTDTLDLIVQAG